MKTANQCPWYDLGCNVSHEVADAGLAAISRSIAAGAETLMGEIVKAVDQSAAVPLADPTYRDVYFGFLKLGAPLIGVVMLIATVVACLRRDPGTLARTGIGVGIAGVGGAFYIVFAQLLLAIDNWLSHAIVRITGHEFAESINQLAAGFKEVAGAPGEVAADMLLILLMLTMLVAGLVLWFVLILRKVAILVVVAFAPLLIVGYVWEPTRPWVRRLTEALIALVFTKSAIFALFGVGLALLSRGTSQTISDFVAATVLMCGACFAPMVMLRLVHFAADAHLAQNAMGTIRDGTRPVTSRLHSGGHGRHDYARSQGQAPKPEQEQPISATSIPVDGKPPLDLSGEAASAGTASNGASTTGTTAAGAAGVAGAAGPAALLGQELKDRAHDAGDHARGQADDFTATQRRTAEDRPDPADHTRHGPGIPPGYPPNSPGDPS